MNFKLFSIISAIVFAFGIGAIFLVNQFLQIQQPRPAQLALQNSQPARIAGWDLYTDTLRSFTIQHPVSSPAIAPDPNVPNDETRQILHFSTATDLSIGDLIISRTDDRISGVTISISSDMAHCFDFPTASSSAIIINTVPFKTAAWGDAAMGGERGIIREYRTLRDNTCYIVESIVHYRDAAFLAGVTGAKPHAASSADLKQQTDWIEQQQRIQAQIVKTFSFSQ